MAALRLVQVKQHCRVLAPNLALLIPQESTCSLENSLWNSERHPC